MVGRVEQEEVRQQDMGETATDLVESEQLAELPEQRDRPTSIELSREIAVQRIFQGGASIIAGAALLLKPLQSFSLDMVALVLGGLGLVQLGRAAKHLKKYGSRASLIGFVTATALGLSTVSLAVFNWIGVVISVGSIPGWIWFFRTSLWAYYGFGIVMILLVLRALVLWAVDSWGSFRRESADAG